MDSFEVRVQFTSRLKKLGASRDSILKVASFAMENLEHHEDLFNCIVEQLASTSVRNRLNLLGLIDTLCQIPVNSTVATSSVIVLETSIISSNSTVAGNKTKADLTDFTPEGRVSEETSLKRKISTQDPSPIESSTTVVEAEQLPGTQLSQSTSGTIKSSTVASSLNPYPMLVQTNISQIFEHAVPKDSKGALNLSGARKVLGSWRSKNLFPSEIIDSIEHSLKSHQFEESKEPVFSRSEIFRRIEEDRERHKRMKEENWIQPSELSERREFEELYDCLEQPSLDSLFDTLEQLHARFLYDTTYLGKI